MEDINKLEIIVNEEMLKELQKQINLKNRNSDDCDTIMIFFDDAIEKYEKRLQLINKDIKSLKIQRDYDIVSRHLSELKNNMVEIISDIKFLKRCAEK